MGQNKTDMTDFAEAGEAAGTLQEICNHRACAAGWWDEYLAMPVEHYRKYFIGTKLMLIVSEIAEAMEGHRKGKMDEHLPQRLSIEVELADALIRIADLAGALGLDLGGAVRDKMIYNAGRQDHTREARVAVGGKTY